MTFMHNSSRLVGGVYRVGAPRPKHWGLAYQIVHPGTQQSDHQTDSHLLSHINQPTKPERPIKHTQTEHLENHSSNKTITLLEKFLFINTTLRPATCLILRLYDADRAYSHLST